MAGIEQYLDLIKNAVYGRDVRQAIYNGIHQCYEDGRAGAVDLVARQQIAELVAPSGEAPSVAEVTDARIGANGVTYTSLGLANRTQFSDLNNAVSLKYNTDLIAGYWNANGSVSVPSSDAEKRTNAFPVMDAIKVLVTVGFSQERAIWVACLFIDENNEPISRPTKSLRAQATNCVFDVPANAKYASLCLRTFNDEAMVFDYQVLANLEGVFGNKISYTAYDGYYHTDGRILNPIGNEEKYINKMNVSNVKSFVYGGMLDRSALGSKTSWAAYCTYDKSGAFIERILIPHMSGSYSDLTYVEVPDDVGFVSFCWRSFGSVYPDIYFMYDLSKEAHTGAITSEEVRRNTMRSSIGFNPSRFKPLYDHLFVNRTGANVTIPHESLYHVRLSRKMGFNVIEANVYKTSDGVFIVNHLNAGKFGGWFHHVDGSTDISDIAVSSVTWDWIVENVRYNSQIPKYRTRPCRLEEFLAECKQQNIIPFISTGDSDVAEMADAYLGKGNYIAYGANRTNCPEAIIYHWASQTSESAILAYCENVGKPFIYGMANPSAFSDTELKSIVDTLHKNGYWIGTSYQDGNWHKYSSMGFDFNGTQSLINRIDNGNICNFDTIYDYSDFIITNAVDTSGSITFTSAGTISPDIADESYSVCGIDLEIVFNGSVTLAAIGERGRTTYTSDGSAQVFICVPIINGSPKFTLECTAGTEVFDMSFKASKF